MDDLFSKASKTKNSSSVANVLSDSVCEEEIIVSLSKINPEGNAALKTSPIAHI